MRKLVFSVKAYHVRLTGRWDKYQRYVDVVFCFLDLLNSSLGGTEFWMFVRGNEGDHRQSFSQAHFIHKKAASKLGWWFHLSFSHNLIDKSRQQTSFWNLPNT